MPPVLILPGLGSSGPEHWQTHWEKQNPNLIRVAQRDWDKPDRNEWIQALDRAIAAQAKPPLLVAHSLACALVAHWTAGAARKLHGALLVAPADVDSDRHTPPEVRCFAPMPLATIEAPCIVAASTDDPFVDVARARFFASAWGARFVAVGACGHINSASKLGDWPVGRKLFEELVGAAR
jgi:predicted alpha/beta hydrolase family esterase